MFRFCTFLLAASLLALARGDSEAQLLAEDRSALKEVQDMVFKILRSATSDGNYSVAAVAQAQARDIMLLLQRHKGAKSMPPATPTIVQLAEIQSTMIRIMRNARLDQDYGTALAAGARAIQIERILRRATGERNDLPRTSLRTRFDELQNATLKAMRQATTESSRLLAVSAAAEATANAELLGLLTGEIAPVTAYEGAG